MNSSWFNTKDCTSLKINTFDNLWQKEPVKSVQINDPVVIRKMMDEIEQIPDGDMMKSFAPEVKSTVLLFQCGDDIQSVEIYGGQFKTPSTGFNSFQPDIEKKLTRDIEALLFPDFGKVLPKIQGVEFSFGSFSITYLGQTKREASEMEKSSASFQTDRFSIKSGDGKEEQTVEIMSGQIPPQPLEVVAGRKKIVILTYEAQGQVKGQSETEETFRLYPGYFQIVKP